MYYCHIMRLCALKFRFEKREVFLICLASCSGLCPRRFRAGLSSRLAYATRQWAKQGQHIAMQWCGDMMWCDMVMPWSMVMPNWFWARLVKPGLRPFFGFGPRQLDKIAFEAEHGDFTLDMGHRPETQLMVRKSCNFCKTRSDTSQERSEDP